MQITDNFRQAMQDYIFLLEKKYPEKTIHNLISTRYALNHFERSILYRGLTTQQTAEERKKRLLVLNNSDQKQETRNPEPFPLHIDLFNVLFTIAAYLRGYPVYLSNDGIVRDASESHDCTGWAEHLEKALYILLQDLEHIKSSRNLFYIDSPMPLCSHFGEIITAAAKNSKSLIEIILDESPDHLLRNATEGILATSDSTIIDKSLLPVLDIPHYLLEKRFGAKLLRLDTV
ncbi:MAG: DUF434 domain-containing protein [Bacteroidales bacterium]